MFDDELMEKVDKIKSLADNIARYAYWIAGLSFLLSVLAEYSLLIHFGGMCK